MSATRFHIRHRASTTRARVGCLETAHGPVETPAFMAVGTKGSVKGLTPDRVAATGTPMLLANTYHLMLRPGAERVGRLGGLHRFMGWPGPILTDSGGFQIFSLGDVRRLDDEGVTFRADLDGAEIRLTPEGAVAIQEQLGSDIAMPLDDCPPAAEGASSGRHAVSADAYATRNQEAVDRTLRWLHKSVAAQTASGRQAMFGIVQGGTDLSLRSTCADEVTRLDLPGYAIGGCAVGEAPETMLAVVRHTAAALPEERPRYLMGVGYERDILEAVQAGVDLFDCVLPTRNGRNATAFTSTGPLRLRTAAYREDQRPIDPACDCLACGRFPRAYIRHLFASSEMLGPILVSEHNIRHFQRLMVDIRRAVAQDNWLPLHRRWPVLRREATPVPDPAAGRPLHDPLNQRP